MSTIRFSNARYKEQILQGMDNVRCHIDDIIIRTDPHEHLQVLDEVLPRLERHGILAKKSKFEFTVLSIEFLGYRVDGEGPHTRKLQLLAQHQVQKTQQNSALT